MASSATRTRQLILCGLFAALTAVGSWIFIPLPFSPVPINLALLFVYLSGSLLGPGYGMLSQVVYVLLGLVGAPVFAHFAAGPGALAGPTGGYIVGYILAAGIAGLGAASSRAPVWRSLSGYLGGMLACFTLGTLWFMHVTGSALAAALALCVIPFLLGDFLKIAAAYFLTKKIRPRLERGEL